MSDILNSGGRILVVGSLAYDHVMRHAGSFKDVILPGNYNVSLPAAGRKVFFGGCGGNIAYGLSLLGERPVLLTQVGKDFDDYGERLSSLGVDISFVARNEHLLTACAFIVTDENENQVTIFDPGAMHGPDGAVCVGEVVFSGGGDKVAWAIIAPDKPSSMLKFARECRDLGVLYIFDPGQQLALFGKDELITAISGAEILIVNEYEAGLLEKKLGVPRGEVARMAGVFIETLGAKGAMVQINRGDGGRAATSNVEMSTFDVDTEDGGLPEIFQIEAVPPKEIVDPTGCGDAYRAGLLSGLMRGFSIAKACRVGALLATYSLECSGTQCHVFEVSEFAHRYKECFGESF